MRSVAELSLSGAAWSSEHQQGWLCHKDCRTLKRLGGAEGTDYGGGIALVGIDFGIEVAHFFG
jgi:hypothetical protein